MKLVQHSLGGRTFLLQFHQIMGEFGNVIPWLAPLHDIAFYTNPKRFEDHLLLRLGCNDREDLTPIQFVTPDESHDYVGGMIRLTKSPEKFIDFRNIETQGLLAHQRYHFVSCLQLRKEYRGKGFTNTLVKNAFQSVLDTHKKVWGVVSDPLLIRWYISLGGILRSPMENKDHLWIISWE